MLVKIQINPYQNEIQNVQLFHIFVKKHSIFLSNREEEKNMSTPKKSIVPKIVNYEKNN